MSVQDEKERETAQTSDEPGSDQPASDSAEGSTAAPEANASKPEAEATTEAAATTTEEAATTTETPAASSDGGENDAAAKDAKSAGARLAAAKAAKAARKAAKKAERKAELDQDQQDAEARAFAGSGVAGDEADGLEPLRNTSVGRAASRAAEWTQGHQNLAFGVIGVAALAGLGVAIWSWVSTNQAHAAGRRLEDAIEIVMAPIRTDDETSEDAADELHFATRAARAEAAVEAYGEVTAEFADTEAGYWAALGRAAALFELGQYDQAREVYETILQNAGTNETMAWMALEGIGFTYEATGDLPAALERYEEIGSLGDEDFQAPSDFHSARIHSATGNDAQAESLLRALDSRIQEESASGEPRFPYVAAQTQARLRVIDPSATSGGSDLGLDGLTPELREQLMRQLQQQGGVGQ